MNAHTNIVKPLTDDAPSADAPIEVRDSWCRARVESMIDDDPTQGLPSDVRPSQHFETEFSYCKLDPQAYERETRIEG